MAKVELRTKYDNRISRLIYSRYKTVPDFIDDYAVDPWLHNDWSFLFLVTFEAGRLVRLELVPVLLTLAEVHLAQQPLCAQLCRRMQALSEEFGTRFTESGERLIAGPI